MKMKRKCINCSWTGDPKETKGGTISFCPVCGDNTRAEGEAKVLQVIVTNLETNKVVYSYDINAKKEPIKVKESAISKLKKIVKGGKR
jgi:uncharacterized Zn finger protein (UPF0148 family)